MIEKFINYSGWLIGLIALVFAVFTWFISRKRKEITYTVNSFTLVEKNKSTVPKLMLLFDNQEIDSFTATTIYLWNSGNDAIRGTDIVESKPLVISAPDTATILDVQIVKQNEPSNQFSVELRDGTAIITFDYMNKNHGSKLQVYHTGPADDFALDGKIIGGDSPKKQEYIGNSDRKKEIIGDIIRSCICIAGLLTFSFLTSSESYPSGDVMFMILDRMITLGDVRLVDIFAYTILTIVSVCKTISCILRPCIPKGLR